MTRSPSERAILGFRMLNPEEKKEVLQKLHELGWIPNPVMHTPVVHATALTPMGVGASRKPVPRGEKRPYWFKRVEEIDPSLSYANRLKGEWVWHPRDKPEGTLLACGMSFPDAKSSPVERKLYIAGHVQIGHDAEVTQNGKTIVLHDFAMLAGPFGTYEDFEDELVGLGRKLKQPITTSVV